MPDQVISYERISRPYFGLNGTASLWLGPDHILQVTNGFGWERYRRWFFRDIQALVARRNATRLVWNLVLGFGGLGLGFAAILVVNESSGSDPATSTIIGSILGGVGLVFLTITLVNTVLGPTCSVHIQTPTGMEKLAAPGRMAAYERVVGRLRPQTELAVSRSGAATGLGDVAAAFDQTPTP